MLSFDELGDGPAVVLLHGHPFNRSMWAPQREPLVEAGFRVVIPDLRGYGKSPARAGTVTMRELAEDVHDLLDALGITRAALIGLSMGGLIVMEFVLHYIERVTAIGLVATTAQPVTPDERQERLAMAVAVESDGMEPLVHTMRQRLYGPQCPGVVVTQVDDMMRTNNPIGAAAAMRGRVERPDYRGALSALELPVFVCVGTADTFSTGEVTRELLASLTSPRVLLLPDVGHLPNLEAPTNFNQALIDFLQQAHSG